MTLILFCALLQERPQEGPHTHQVMSATSRDGLAWTEDGKVLLEHASVPCAIVTPEGKVLLYFVDASRAPENVNCVESTDGGKTFQKTRFAIQGMTAHKAVDPSIVRLENGKYRLYYFGCRRNPDEEGTHAIYSAISDDGIRFTEEKRVFDREGLVDPDVFWTGKEWLMYVFGLGRTEIARSADGLSFEYVGPLHLKFWGTTAPVRLEDGTFRLYAFTQRGANKVCSFASKDCRTWTQEEGTRLAPPEGKEITDPFVVRLKEGTWKMFYKIQAKPRNRPREKRP